MKFSAKEIGKIDNGEGYWNSIRVGVFEDDKQIGEYVRNYSCLYNTFFAFQQNEKWYALYSKDYTATRIMELPSCRDLGGEDPHSWGFCPVEYYVPFEDKCINAEHNGAGAQFGFVAGCVWGDDSSWKIQYLDLSQVSTGFIKRDDRFGYVEMMPNLSLKQSVDFYAYYHDEDDDAGKRVNIACQTMFSLVERRDGDGV